MYEGIERIEEELKTHGKTKRDILFVSNGSHYGSFDEFVKMVEEEWDEEGYISDYDISDFVFVGKNFVIVGYVEYEAGLIENYISIDKPKKHGLKLDV